MQVHSVLEKLQPDMIALDAQFVGKVDRAPSEVVAGHPASSTPLRGKRVTPLQRSGR